MYKTYTIVYSQYKLLIMFDQFYIWDRLCGFCDLHKRKTPYQKAGRLL